MKFNLTPQDFLRSKVLAPGWYRSKVVKYSEEAADTDGSLNAIIDLQVIDGQFAGVPLKRYFNEKETARGFAASYIKAFYQVDEAKGGSFDLKDTEGKVVDVYVSNEMYKGTMRNNCQDFRRAA